MGTPASGRGGAADGGAARRTPDIVLAEALEAFELGDEVAFLARLEECEREALCGVREEFSHVPVGEVLP